MLGIMFQKMLSKKWMFLCLLLSSILLIATVISFPLYQNAVFDRMLRSEFQDRHSQTGEWPAKLSKSEAWTMNIHGENMRRAEEQLANMGTILNTDTKESISFYRLQLPITSSSERGDSRTESMKAAFLSNLPQHVTILAGNMYSETGITEDGCIEVVISQNCAASANILTGDILEVNRNSINTPVARLVVTGIFKCNENDPYWEIGTDELSNICLMQEELFRSYFATPSKNNYNVIRASQCYLFSYNSLKAESVDTVIDTIVSNNFAAETSLELLETFQKKQPLLSVSLLILEVPVLILLGAFLFMISSQMYESEKNEISVIKSRGSSGNQIFRLYLYQNLFLGGVSLLFGIPLGIFFVRILGSTSNFLEFELHRTLEINFDAQVWLYLAAAFLMTVLIMTLPAVRHSRVSIVHLKQQKNIKKRAWWEMFFLDFICLGISLYGYYSYSKSKNLVAANALSGRSLDPLLYICSSLFIVGTGLLFLRLQPLLVKLIFTAGKRFWHPASYVSFLENQKNGRRQQFIMLFLILTVSLGSFYATVARTILQNALENVTYLDGTDIIIRETWKDNASVISRQKAAVDTGYSSSVDDPRYDEPDFYKYSSLNAESVTKVLYDDTGSGTNNVSAYVNIDNNPVDVCMMGIHTKEFGEMTWVSRNLTEEHYYTYLNLLADSPKGILISRNLQEQFGCKKGDKLLCHYNSVMGSDGEKIEVNHSIFLEVIGCIDYWPGYASSITSLNYANEVITQPNYLIIANYATLQEAFRPVTEPYEVWIKLKEGTSSAEVAQWIQENNISIRKFVDRQDDLRKTLEDPLLQGTNGVLTMSFLVMILLCAAGYLIYWIMSIRSRELVFGTLRAFGMHKKEVFHILILEQLFSGILSMLAGAGIGIAASQMYVPILQTAYAASNQALPILLYTDPRDMIRLYGTLTVMMAGCLMVLILLVLKLNITKALKLGEG